MPVDRDTVKRIAHLARIAVSDADIEALKSELSAILDFVEQLNEVDVSGIEPMTSVVEMSMKQRPDKITAGDQAGEIVANAPAGEKHFFAVPKVVE